MSTASDEAGQKIFLHTPEKGVSPRRDLESCLEALDRDLRSSGLPRSAVLKQTVFLRAENRSRYAELKRGLYPVVEDFFSRLLPATTWVGQPPEGNGFAAVEALIQTSLTGIQIKHLTWEEHAYVVLLDPPHKLLYVGGMGGRSMEPGVSAASRAAFGKMQALLLREDMGLSHIVRQWNYIEGILTRTGKGNRQHYQIFNDVRGQFYGTDHFEHGFPAATGIGQKSGGVIIDCIAVRGTGANEVFPLRNPGQVDAHRYSQEVLVGEISTEAREKMPPQFERGKILLRRRMGTIFISGTASIVGEMTVGVGDVIKQTRTTISNIARLVAPENLAGLKIRTASPPFLPAGLRVYVKHEEDIPHVREVCREAYEVAPTLYVTADICRSDLLVEIEGVLYVNMKVNKRRQGEIT